MVDFLYSLDISVLYFINQSLSTPALDRFFSIITNVNNWYIAYIILLAISFFKGGVKGKLAAGGIILLIIVTDQMSHNILKELFQRIRPCNQFTDILTPLGCTGSLSFPSNHAVNNFAAAVFFFRLFPNLKWVLFVPASLVALSRVYLGLHFPSDILGGAIIGAIFGYIFASGVLYILKKKKELPVDSKEKSIEGLVIRKTTPHDIPLVLSLIKELADYEKLTHEVTANAELLKKHLFDNKIAEVVIAEYYGKTAGQVLFFYNFSTFLGRPGIYLEDLYVKPEFRGKGIGKALLNYLIKRAKEEKLGRVEWVVLDWNEPAINFYKQIGAEPKNEWIIFRLPESKF